MTKETTPERIDRAALQLSPFIIASLPPPARHHDIIRHVRAEGWAGDVSDQGFMTNEGRFVDRKAAWVIADAAGQITRLPGGVDGLLFSENLW